MPGYDVQKHVGAMISVFTEVIQRYEADQKLLQRLDDETQDLLHEIEISKPKNARDGYLIYKDLKDVRIRRREVKDELAQLAELYDFCTKNSNGIKSRLQQIESSYVKTINKQRIREYFPRQRNNLTICNKE
jgi:hypothetical protein